MDNKTPAQIQLDARIQTICDELLMDGRTFTACDISNKLKIEGFAVRHLDIAPKVRDYMQPLIDSGVSTCAGDYGYALVFPTTFYTPNGVYIYAPVGTDIGEYKFPKMLWTGNVTDADRRIEIGQILDIQPPASVTTVVLVYDVDDSVVERIKDIFVDEIGIDRADLVPAARLSQDLDVDELDLVELAIRAEEEFGIEIPEEDIKRFQTFGDVLAYAQHRLNNTAQLSADKPTAPSLGESLVALAAAVEDDDEVAADKAATDAVVSLMSIMPKDVCIQSLRNTRERLATQRELVDKYDALTDVVERKLFGEVITRVVEAPKPEPKPAPSVTVTGFAADGKTPICGDGRGMAWQPVPVTPTGQPTQVNVSLVPAVGLGKKVGRRVVEGQGRVRIPGKMLKPGVTVFDIHFNGNETVVKPL